MDDSGAIKGGLDAEIIPDYRGRPPPNPLRGRSSYRWLDCPVGGAILFRKKLKTVMGAWKAWRKLNPEYRAVKFQFWVSQEDGRAVAKRRS